MGADKSRSRTTSQLRFLEDGGVMGKRIRSFAWDATSLGPPTEWPTLLKSSIRLMLTSRQPMFIWWGREHIQFYNDTYAEAFAARQYPSALGHPGSNCPVDIWQVLGTQLKFVMQKRGAIWQDEPSVPTAGNRNTELWSNFSLSPIENDDDVFGVFAVFSGVRSARTRDIAQQKEDLAGLDASKNELARSLNTDTEQRAVLNAILEAAPVAIGVANAQGALTLINEETRRVWGSEAPLSRSVAEYAVWKGWFPPGTNREGQLLAAEDWPLARALQGEAAPRELVEIETFENPPKRKTIITSASPVRDSTGLVQGAVVAIVDVTDRVLAEQELHTASRRKDEFLAVLAHEMRNPLAPIAAAADVLRLNYADNDHIQRTASVLTRQVKHLTGLLDDLLDLSRVRRGAISLDKTDLDVKQIVAMAIEQVQPLIEARRHTLNVHCGPEPTIVVGDRRRLLQVVANLLQNAAKYTPEHGKLDVSVNVSDESVCILVRDNGIGMAPEFVEKAFDLFSQADHQDQGVQIGLGIGLALVKRLTELQGGSVKGASEGLGKGCTMTVCLPQAVRNIKQQPSPALVPPHKGTKTILLADDNVDAADMLAALLRSVGHDIVVVHSARAVLEFVGQRLPDAYLLNIGLPGMDGYELARRIRAIDHDPQHLLIAITGFGQSAEIRAAYDAGFDYHFIKPVPIERLSELLAYGHLRIKQRA